MRKIWQLRISGTAPIRQRIGLFVATFGVLATIVGMGAVAAGQITDQYVIRHTAHTYAAKTRDTSVYGGGALMAADPSGGYWTTTWLGAVTSHDGVATYGSPATSGVALTKPIIGMESTPDGKGYWLVGSDGGVFAYGDAQFYGSTGVMHLSQPIVGMAATPDGGGYWLVASDGGIFTFGDAAFYGSTGAMHLSQPMVGMAVTPDGGGYWLVGSDGGVFAYGDAQFYGSTGAMHLNQPIVGMAATPDGGGYWLVASDGGIFTYGDAAFYGSLGADSGSVLGMIIDPSAVGYTLVEANGSAAVFPTEPTSTGPSALSSATPPASEPTTTPPTTTPPSSAPATSGANGNPSWIVADWAIAKMQNAGLSQSLTSYFFDNPRTYLIVYPRDGRIDAEVPNATRVERFTSFATMQSAISGGQLMPGISAVMYDNEGWSFTPVNEQNSPIQYAAQAEALAHQHHLLLIFTPAVNLANLSPASSGSHDKYVNYLAEDMAAGSRASDVFDIQSQQAEGTPQFTSFVTQAAAQARAANPNAVIMAGIGPNPSGRTVTSGQILGAVQAIRGEVSGFWLNMPAGTPQCPQCGTAQPQVAVSFLQSLASSLGAN